MARYVALAALALAVLGAALHPLLFILGIMPFDTRQLMTALDLAKSFIADFLAWGLIGLLVAMGVMVLIGRSRQARAKGVPAHEVGPYSKTNGGMVVAITAFNEAEAISAVVRDFGSQDGVIETIVVDNNSRDATAALATAAGARVVRERRQGYGYACLRGLLEGAKVQAADVIVLVEGDGTFAGADLKKFQAYIDEADLVVGTRVVPGLVETGSQMDYFFTWGNIAVSWLLRLRFWDSQFLGAARLSDVGCTFRAIRRDALLRILPALEVGGDHFSPHMMLVALDYGLSLVEIPVSFRRRIGVSKGASQNAWKGFAVGMAMVWHILSYRPRRPTTRRPHASPAPALQEDVAASIPSSRS